MHRRARATHITFNAYGLITIAQFLVSADINLPNEIEGVAAQCFFLYIFLLFLLFVCLFISVLHRLPLNYIDYTSSGNHL